jgi:hypothetical protein
MDIMVNKEALDDLLKCAKENIDFISTVIARYISYDELVGAIEGKLDEIMYAINRAYNPELVDLKRQSYMYYQKWLVLKDIDQNAAEVTYLEYFKFKRKIESLEIPF